MSRTIEMNIGNEQSFNAIGSLHLLHWCVYLITSRQYLLFASFFALYNTSNFTSRKFICLNISSLELNQTRWAVDDMKLLSRAIIP